MLAQGVLIDQQKIAAGRAHPDSNFVNYLGKTAMAFSRSITQYDSAESLLTEALKVAEQIDYRPGIIEVRESLAQYYFQKGKLSPALNMLLKNDVMAVQIGDSTRLFTTLRLVSMVYMKIGDMNMARVTLRRRQSILDNNGIKGLKDTSYHMLSQYNTLATFYSLPQINNPDSAEYFYRKISVLGKNTSSHNLWEQLSNGGLGKFYAGKKQYDSSIYYYKLAMEAANSVNRFDNYYGFEVAMADIYRQSGKIDSAFKYAYIVYEAATKFSYAGMLVTSSGLLANLYKEQHKFDSAVKYMAIESQYKDSVWGQESLKNIQTLTSDQQMREMDRQREKDEAIKEYKTKQRTFLLTGGLILLLAVIGFMYRVNKQRSQSKKEIESAYNNLKSTQAQLVQSEKMASLGELTAGIAHEIQNPLNFVNNFSEVNIELIEELKSQKSKLKSEEQDELLDDILSNSQKINHHGKRADAIVKGMLQHSRASSSVKEPTDINALCDEYLRLSYHGLRAKDKSFNATLNTDFDETIGKINIIPQDIGRVVLNLLTNAFYAASLPSKGRFSDSDNKFNPTVWMSTKKENGKVFISVRDNGPGIPQNILDKIFQPFFTTKPTGEGTGLGLSMSYDIVTKGHGGELIVETVTIENSNGGNTGTTFKIILPA